MSSKTGPQKRGGPGLARRACGSLSRGAAFAGRAGLARRCPDGDPQQVISELALAGQQLPGEVIGAVTSTRGEGSLPAYGSLTSGSAGAMDRMPLTQVSIAPITAAWFLRTVPRISSCSSLVMVRASVMVAPPVNNVLLDILSSSDCFVKRSRRLVNEKWRLSTQRSTQRTVPDGAARAPHSRAQPPVSLLHR